MSFIDDGELFRSSVRAYVVTWLLLEGQCCEEEAVDQGSYAPFPSFLYPLGATGLPKMRRDGACAERKHCHMIILLRNRALPSVCVCRVLSC